MTCVDDAGAIAAKEAGRGRRRLTVLCAAMTAVLALGAPAPPRIRVPALMIWAWERPTTIDGEPGTFGVAFLAASYRLSGQTIEQRPRFQPLHVADDTPVLAVVRVDADPVRPPAYDELQLDTLVAAITRAAAASGRSVGVQVDFDAPVSARPFYGRLLARLRRTLPPRSWLSMTALASWCLGDPWIANLPVDEAVPMLFRMGPDEDAVRRHLADGGDFGPAVCRVAAGVATDEAVPKRPPGRRTYVFGPRTLSASDLERLAHSLER
jgi:hypothetical protein